MVFIIYYAILIFIVFCADSIEENRSILHRMIRATGWMITLYMWFTRHNHAKLTRVGAIIWFMLTTGWLLALEHDRLHPVFLIIAQGTMMFVVYCVDLMSQDLQRKHIRKFIRSALWVIPVTGYLKHPDGMRMIQASICIWIFLTSGWFFSLLADHLVW